MATGHPRVLRYLERKPLTAQRAGLAITAVTIVATFVSGVAMWVVIIFSLVHMYMAIREDMTHRQTAVSAMISGWRFFR